MPEIARSRVTLSATTGSSMLMCATEPTVMPFLPLRHENCRRNLERLDSQEGLDSLYRKIYAKESVRGDGESLATWQIVRQHLLEKVVPVGGAALAPAAPMGAHKKLRKILDVEAPRLRRQAAPATYPNVQHDDGSEAAVP